MRRALWGRGRRQSRRQRRLRARRERRLAARSRRNPGRSCFPGPDRAAIHVRNAVWGWNPLRHSRMDFTPVASYKYYRRHQWTLPEPASHPALCSRRRADPRCMFGVPRSRPGWRLRTPRDSALDFCSMLTDKSATTQTVESNAPRALDGEVKRENMPDSDRNFVKASRPRNNATSLRIANKP